MSCWDVSRTGRHTLVRRAGECLVVLALVVFRTYATQAEAPRPLRVITLPDASGLVGADASRRLTAARDNGVDAVFIPISIYSADDPAGAEAIDSVIRAARDRGLRVHASVPIMVAVPAGALPASRDHVVYRHPEWLMVPREMALELQAVDQRSPDYLGRLARWTRAHSDRVDGIYVSPLQPDAASHIVDAVRRLASRYQLDGVHFDGVRFPGRDFDYGVRSLDMFRDQMRRTLLVEERLRIDTVEALDPFGYPEELPDEWERFRTTQLTALIAQLRTAVASARRDIVVSAAAIPGADIALGAHLQDWRTWFDNRFVDALTGSAATTTTLLYSYEALVDPPAGGAGATAAPMAGSASP